MRMGGLASGMDTEAIINAMLEAERIPQYRLEAQITETEDKLAAWSQVDSAVSDLYSKSSALISYSNWQRMKVTPGDSAILNATATISADPATYDIHVEHLAKSHRIATDPQATIGDPLNLEGDFTIGGQLVTMALTDSLSDLRDKINTAAGTMADTDKVTASIINTSLVITRNATGDTTIDLADGTNGVLKSLGVLDAGDLVKNELQAAQNLSATVDGIAIDAAANSGHTSIVRDVTFTFTATGDTTLEIGRDTAFVRGMIDDFIAAYNEAMDVAAQSTSVNLSEAGELDSHGLLQTESLVHRLQQSSRALITNQVTDPGILDQAFNSLQTIGIWTSGRDNRLAVVDSDRLDDALKNNWAEVEDLFRDYEGGIVRQLDRYLDSMTSPLDGAIDARMTNMKTSIDDMWDEYDSIDVRITALEDQLWEQFTRMEETLSRINNQGQFVLAALGAQQQNSANKSTSKK